MSIKINIEPDVPEEEPVEKPRDISISLEIRKTLDGKIMILDHMFFDIILDTESKTIITFPKERIDDETYQYQNDYFKHLMTEGVITPESIVSGNVYGSLQANYPESANENINPTQVVLLSTSKFILENKPALEMLQYIDTEIEDHLIDPTPEDSTELGEIPHKEKKGSVGVDRIRRYLSGFGQY
jgi:hypothetical protein